MIGQCNCIAVELANERRERGVLYTQNEQRSNAGFAPCSAHNANKKGFYVVLGR